MEDLKVEKVMDRRKVADAIHGFLDAGLGLLEKEKYEAPDFAKIKLLRTMGAHINAGVAMVQQETAMARARLVQERMRQLGYGEAKQLK